MTDAEFRQAFAQLAKLIEETNGRMDKRLDAVDRRLDAKDTEFARGFAQLAKLIEDTSQSLQAEMEGKAAELRAEMQRGFERIDAATRRNGTTIVGGALAIAALNRWAKSRDGLDGKRDRALADLRRRVGKIERRHRRRSG